MVKKTCNIAIFIILLLVILTIPSCLILYPFQDISDIDERMEQMNNLTLVNTFPPLDTGNGDYSFVVMSDVHIGDNNTNGLERLPQLIETNPEIKFAVLTGDLTSNGKHGDFQKYIEIAKELADIGVPFYPVLGNHDLVGDGWGFWKDNIGSTIYRIDDANATLIFLDSANLYFGKEQLDWLENELNRETKRAVFVFNHVPLFASGPAPWVTISDLTERARAVSIFKNKCNIVFAGHAHSRNIYNVGNVEYITLDEFESTHKYCIVTVRGSAISYSWGTL